MLARRDKDATKIYNSISVDLQLTHGGPPRRRYPDDKGQILIPGKVISPTLPARMKKRRHLARNGVDGVNAHVLVIVTTLACPGEIVQFVGPALASWNNVFDGKRIRREPSRTLTILATSAGQLGDFFPVLGLDGRVTHLEPI